MTTADEQVRAERARQVALFRYRLIQDVIDVRLSSRQRGPLVTAIADREHDGPFGEKITVSRQTIDRWCRWWRRDGFAGLVPQPARVHARTPAEVLDMAAGLKRENLARTATQVARILRASAGWSPSERTLQRHFEHLAGVALLLHVGAEKNGGLFDPKWLDQPNFTPVLAVLPRETILDVIKTSFATDVSGFKKLAAEAPAVPFLDKYLFNPLVARPFVRRADGRLTAPVPQLISRRMSPLEWYYAGVGLWGGAFASELGYLFEDYVGRQFATVPGATVVPEIEYRRGKDRMDTTDWFVVLNDVVLLVEAKAGILKAGARAGDDSLTEMMARTVGKAITQINRTYELIRTGAAEVAHIPRDRPILGMVATLDPWYMANSPLGRKVLPACDVPVTVCSAREIESLVGLGQRIPIGAVLREVMDDTERSSWSLGIALQPHHLEGDRNPMLDQAWKHYPFN